MYTYIYIYIYILCSTPVSRSKNLEIRGFDPSRLFFRGATLRRIRGSPRISQPRFSSYVNCCYVTSQCMNRV